MIGSEVGWWGVGALFMLICMAVMMPRMMWHGHWDHGGHRWRDDPERTLADRLARGEIDTEEYERLLEALRRSDDSARA